MKTVFDKSSQIVHLWANKTQPSATTRVRTLMAGGRAAQAFFEGDRYYSYGHHYCIGRHLPDGYVALNLEKNSSTTNGHVQEAKHATRHLKQIVVYDPEADVPNLAATQNLVDRLLAKALKARADGNRPRYLAETHNVIADFNTFAKLLKSKLRIKQIDSETWSPEKHRAQVAKQEAAAKVKAAAKLKKFREENAENIATWRSGEYVYLPSELPAMLRLTYHTGLGGHYGTVTPDSWIVETSKGAEIPAEDARKLWPFIQRVMKGKKDYEVGMTLGHYRLTQIRRDGSIVVGCHDIPFDEIELMAKALGLLNLEEVAA